MVHGHRASRITLFIWKDRGHYLSRLTLNKPLNQGGLSVKNCALQALALAAKQTNAIITQTTNPPWVSFARMWTHKKLHRLQPYTNFLSHYVPATSALHRLLDTRSTTPVWYKRLCNVANENPDLCKKPELPT